MVRRLFDIVCATAGLVAAAPFLGLAMLGIRLTDGAPVLYRASRAGVGGRPFVMYKLRTMRVERGEPRSRVTGIHDPRVFRLGNFLRHTKLDEFPQLVNVLRGDMSIVGPRPEDPYFVTTFYGPTHRETLTVRPGLAGPGSLYHDTHGRQFLGTSSSEAVYVDRMLPLKLALDLVYVRAASLRYDIAIILRTLGVITGSLVGRTKFPDPPELSQARQLVVPLRPAPAAPNSSAAPGTPLYVPPSVAAIGRAFSAARPSKPRSEVR